MLLCRSVTRQRVLVMITFLIALSYETDYWVRVGFSAGFAWDFFSLFEVVLAFFSSLNA